VKPAPVKPVVLFYVQHLLGIGHLRRAALIARAILAAGLDLSFASGGAPAGELDIGAAKLIQLPPAMAADVHFSAILGQAGRPIDDAWRDRRKGMLLDAFEAVRPDLVLVEMFPFGRRQFAFELLPLLEAAKARGLPTAVSLRDILVAKSKPERIAETVAVVRRLIDRVLVHGDPRLVGLEATFPGASEIADRLVYTGYVADTAAPAPGTPVGAAEGAEILVSAGGGAVGGPLLRAALAVRPATSVATAPWRLIAGPNLPAAEFAELQRTAALQAGGPAAIAVERFRPDFPALLARARLSLSQAGYNTVMDILAVGARALVLPFAEGAENEQTLRARLLAERGLLSLMEPPIEGARLATAIEAALLRPRPQPGALDLGGAAETARQLARLLE
jgi:predicted glycosyltransferase